MSASSLRITVVLPFAPDERQSHDSLIAAASALQGATSGATLNIVQFAMAGSAVIARAAGDAALWWEFTSSLAAIDASPVALAAMVREVLETQGGRDDHRHLILLPPGPQGEEVAALIAADLGGPSLGRCNHIALNGPDLTARRPAFGGRLWIELRTQAGICCATWRPAARELPALEPLPKSSIHQLELRYRPPQDEEVELVQSPDAQPRLEGAAAVVSGGRGMDGPEGFELLARIAASLGAALGGSLPAVDAGWVPVARQIGQSGKFVAPRLYFAVGISGTPQHLAGIADSARIVALNKDPDAAIFTMAEVGAVGDWREILPLVAQRLEAKNS